MFNDILKEIFAAGGITGESTCGGPGQPLCEEIDKTTAKLESKDYSDFIYKTNKNAKGKFVDRNAQSMQESFEKIHENSNSSCVAGALNCDTDYIAPKLGVKSVRTLLNENEKSLKKYKIPSKPMRGIGNYVNNNSIDAWEIHEFLRGENLGTDFFTGDANTKYSRGLPKGLDLATIPIGSILGQGDAKDYYTDSPEGERSRHGMEVVGYAEDGTPMVYDYGALRKLTNLKALGNYGDGTSSHITKITVPKGYENYNYYNISTAGKNKAKDLGFKEGDKVSLNSTWKPIKAIEKGVNEHEEAIGKHYDISKSTLDKFAKLLPGLSNKETKLNNNDGTSADAGFIPTSVSDSWVGNMVGKPVAKMASNAVDAVSDLFSEDSHAKQDWELEVQSYKKYPDDPEKREKHFNTLREKVPKKGGSSRIDSSVGAFKIKDLSAYMQKKKFEKGDLYGAKVNNSKELELGSVAALSLLAEKYKLAEELYPDLNEDQLVKLSMIGYSNDSKLKSKKFVDHYIKNDYGLKDTTYEKILNYEYNTKREKYALGGKVQKDNNMKNNYTKFLFGGRTTEDLVGDYLAMQQNNSSTRGSSPASALAENEIMKAKAQRTADSNPWTQGIDIFGNAAMQVGTSLMNQGIAGGEGADGKGLQGFLASGLGQGLISGAGVAGNAASQDAFAMGGQVENQVPVEAEGKEIVQTPDGQMQELQGPSHENGGIEMFLPEGTEIFSKRLKGADGKTMADRKKAREKGAGKIEKLFKDNPSDKMLKKTLDKTLAANEKQEQADLAQMEEARKGYNNNMKMMMGGIIEQYFTGTAGVTDPFDIYKKDPAGAPTSDKAFIDDTEDIYDNPFTDVDQATPIDVANIPDLSYDTEDMKLEGKIDRQVDGAADKVDWKKLLGDASGITAGDAVGFAGNLQSIFGPKKNTLANRATDQPNINAYKDFGKDALKKIQEAKQFAAGEKDSNIMDIALNEMGARNRMRGQSRGINTMRAFDVAGTNAAEAQKSKARRAYAQQLMQLIGQESGLENQQDRMVMQGEQARDLADRQDKDNFSTQLGKDIASQGEGLRKMGSDMNQVKTRNVTQKTVGDLYEHYGINGMTGDIKFKAQEALVNDANYFSTIKGTGNEEAILKGKLDGTYIIKGKTLYNKAGQVIDPKTLKPKQ